MVGRAGCDMADGAHKVGGLVCPVCVGRASAGGRGWGSVAGHDRRERGEGPGDWEPALELCAMRTPRVSGSKRDESVVK